jgi:V/A-type H+-transporting ATPase subunit D
MSGSATRSALLDLGFAREAARRGRELLDQKREILQRELSRRETARQAAREKAAAALALARKTLREARVELGRDAVDAAALAQTPAAHAEIVEARVLGVSTPSVRLLPAAWTLGWSPGGTSESLDRAAAEFAGALPLLAELAQAQLGVRNFARALARTNRRLNALEMIVLPGLEREIRDVASALEEDERDEAFRRKRWFQVRRAAIDSSAS